MDSPPLYLRPPLPKLGPLTPWRTSELLSRLRAGALVRRLREEAARARAAAVERDLVAAGARWAKEARYGGAERCARVEEAIRAPRRERLRRALAPVYGPT